MSDVEKMQVDSETNEASKNESKSNSDTDKNKKNPNTKPTNKKARKRKIDAIKDVATEAPPKKKRKKSRGWSDAEEELFRTGLELYGRDWHKIASHVGNDRNAASIRSHAQVFFLKVLQSNGKLQLPPKVLQSGNGFTLSGKPLNKYSCVAIRHFGSAQNVPNVDGVISDEENAIKSRTKKPKSNPQNKKKAVKKKKKRKKYYDSDSDEEYQAMASTATTNTTQRRSGRNRKKIQMTEAAHISNPFGLRTDIQTYDTLQTQTANKKKHDLHIYEPFKIEYCPHALLIADIHSHLLRTVEIMGLLGGQYDEASQTLYIKKCYPLAEEQQNEETVSAHSTEMLAVSERIQKDDGLQLVGWYHSHPCFENVPSNLDCHQHAMNKHQNEEKQPYVGLIVQSLWQTYNQCSHQRWFNTLPLNSGIKDYEYMALQFVTRRKVFYEMGDADLFAQIKALIERYNDAKYDIYRTNLGENGIGHKILNNIAYHLKDENMDEDDDQIQIFVKKVERLFMEKCNIWWVTNKPKMENGGDVAVAVSVADENANSNSNDKENENCLN